MRGRARVAALAAGALATGGIAAGAVAATTGGGDAASDLAAAINERAGTSITADDVEGAYIDLLEERLDEAVAAGRLTQEQADEMLQRAQDAPRLPGLGGTGVHRRGGPGGPHGEVLGEVAATLGLSEEQIRQRLRDGRTLAQIAQAQGVGRADLLAAVEAALTDAGVDADRAAEVAERIAEGTGPGRGRGRGPWGGRP